MSLRRVICFLALLILGQSFSLAAAEQRLLVLVKGASGLEEYEEQFSAWADLWQRGAQQGHWRAELIGTDEGDNDREKLLNLLAQDTTKAATELWLVFIGHGTFDGRSAKFNLRGPDISADELKKALADFKNPLAVLQCASASAPFMNALAGENRVIITATRSGSEVNATRFGGYLARAISDPAADLDKDGQTSLLEAYLLASRLLTKFYSEDGRLATEHPLLDDNGDGQGTPADWFKATRATKAPADGKAIDGTRAHQFHFVRGQAEQELSPELRARRDDLERQVEALRARKKDLGEAEYYRQLEVLLLDIARIYEAPASP